jgi:hypothetical protein
MESITQIRQSSAGTDAYGEPIIVTTEIELEAKVAARTGSKTVGAAEITVTSGLTVYLPPDTNIQIADIFVVRGERYVLDGEPFASKIPNGGGKVELNRSGMRKLLRSDELGDVLAKRMRKVQAALPGSELEIAKSPTRVRVKVSRGSDFDEANTGDLSRALDLAGGLRGTKIKKTRARRRS